MSWGAQEGLLEEGAPELSSRGDLKEMMWEALSLPLSVSPCAWLEEGERGRWHCPGLLLWPPTSPSPALLLAAPRRTAVTGRCVDSIHERPSCGTCRCEDALDGKPGWAYSLSPEVKEPLVYLVRGVNKQVRWTKARSGTPGHWGFQKGCAASPVQS